MQPRLQSIGQRELCLSDPPGGVLEGGSCFLSLLTSSGLEQQVEQLNAKIEKVHEKVSFVSTYKDHEYPIKSVQVASLVCQLQQTKDSQQVGEPNLTGLWGGRASGQHPPADPQDELDDLGEMCRMVLASISSQIQKKKKALLGSLVLVSGQLLG